MYKIFQSVVIVSLIVSCSNNSKTENGKSNEGNEVSNGSINNPATADNPQAKPQEFAILTFKTTDHNFGDILENQQVETVYEFVNTGKVDLLINNCDASCGCTVPDWPRTPIKPGGTGRIKVKFDSAGKSGVNNKKVTVFANIKEGSMVLSFTANVRALKKSE